MELLRHLNTSQRSPSLSLWVKKTVFVPLNIVSSAPQTSLWVSTDISKNVRGSKLIRGCWLWTNQHRMELMNPFIVDTSLWSQHLFFWPKHLSGNWWFVRTLLLAKPESPLYSWCPSWTSTNWQPLSGQRPGKVTGSGLSELDSTLTASRIL